MEELIAFAGMVVFISVSGVMSPGPLFAANVFFGLKEGALGGIKMAVGHTVVEFPLVLLLGLGAVSLESTPQFRETIAILGALGLFAFAGFQIKSVFSQRREIGYKAKHGAFFAGVVFSALNPFFIIWWFTIGFKLISDSIMLWSLGGILIMFVLHIWMDYIWLGVIALFAKKGSGFLSNRNYKILLFIIAGLLVYFGVSFLTTI